MSTIDGLQIVPLSDWQAFQRLCLDLWKEIWNDANAQEYGGLGQRQNGVDIFGRQNGGDRYAAVQCKDKDNLSGKTLTIEELHSEVKKAKKFRPKLSEYIVAFTGPRERILQDEANRLTEKNKRKGLFSVSVWSWEEIRQALSDHPELLVKHYPQIFTPSILNPNVVSDIGSKISKEVKETSDQLKRSLSDQIQGSAAAITHEIRTAIIPNTMVDLTFSKKLLESRKPTTCLEILIAYADKHWDRMLDIDKYKYLTNKASSYLQLEKYNDAAPLFIQALQYNKDDEMANTNAALGYFLLKNDNEANKHIDTALSKNPLNVNAWSLRIQFVSDTQGLNSIMEQVPQALHNKTEVLWACGMMHLKFQEFKLAESLISKALENDPEKRVELLQLLGSVRLKNLVDHAKQTGFLTFLPEDIKAFEECIQIFTDVLKRMKDSDVTPTKVDALSKRGRIHRFLNHIDAAKKDLDQAIEWDPQNYEASLQRAIIFSEEKDFKEAIKRIEPFAALENSYEARLILADTYRLAKNYIKATEILQGCESWQAPETMRLHALMVMVDAHLELDDMPAAHRTASAAEGVSPTSFVPYLLHAQAERRASHIDEAKEYALKARSLLAPEVQFIEEWRLGDELLHLKLFSDATIVYERIAVPEKDDQLTRGLVQAYYDSEQIQKALNVCVRLLAVHPEVQYATEIASFIYESIGDLKSAISILQTHLRAMPDDPHSRLRLTMVLIHAGKITDAERELGCIQAPSSIDTKDALQYALILVNRGRTEAAVKFLYDLARENPSEEQIQMAYIGVLLTRSEPLSILQNPERVEKDTVVFLESADHLEEFYIIEDRQDADISKREINVDNAIAKVLLGKRVGEYVDLERNPFQQNLMRLKFIKSKYLHALHEKLNTYPKQFPESRQFLALRTPMDNQGKVDAAKFKQQILSTLPDTSTTEVVDQLYRDRRCPLGVLSQAVHRDIVSAYVYFASKPDLGIYSSNGQPTDYAHAKKLLDLGYRIVVDPISLITLHLLNAKELLSDKYGPLLISQSTIDQFSQIYEMRSISRDRPRSTIYQDHGELRIHDLSVEDTKRELDDLAKLIQWMQSNCSVVPVTIALQMKPSEKDEMDDLLGKPFFDSILLAKESNRLLLTDDGVLREFAETQHSIKTIWTHALLSHALEKGFITQEEFFDLTARSISLNLHHISINSNMLMWASEKSEWKPKPPLQYLLFNLTGARCSEDSALTVGCEFFYRIWTASLPQFTRDLMITSLIDALTSNRDPRVVLYKVEGFVASKFRLWPAAEQEIRKILSAWKLVHLK